MIAPIMSVVTTPIRVMYGGALKNRAYSRQKIDKTCLCLQMDLNHAVRLPSRLGHLELYQKYGFTHSNLVRARAKFPEDAYLLSLLIGATGWSVATLTVGVDITSLILAETSDGLLIMYRFSCCPPCDLTSRVP